MTFPELFSRMVRVSASSSLSTISRSGFMRTIISAADLVGLSWKSEATSLTLLTANQPRRVNAMPAKMTRPPHPMAIHARTGRPLLL